MNDQSKFDKVRKAVENEPKKQKWRYETLDGNSFLQVRVNSKPKKFYTEPEKVFVYGKPKALPLYIPFDRAIIDDLPHETIIISEGEICADIWNDVISAKGNQYLHLATTTAGGCKSFKKTDLSVFDNKLIIGNPDDDEEGIYYINNVLSSIEGNNKWIVDLSKFNVDGIKGYDIVNFVEDDNDFSELKPVKWKEWKHYQQVNETKKETEQETEQETTTDDNHYPIPDKNIILHDLCIEKLKVNLRFNVRSEQPEIEVNGKWKPLRETAMLKIYSAIRTRFTYNKVLAKKTVRRPVNFTADERKVFFAHHTEDRRVDIVKDEILRIEKEVVHDGTKRIDNYLLDLFFVKKPTGKLKKLIQWASRYLVVGVIRRTLEPGCKQDEHPIFIGDQGIGKSTLLKFILPKNIRDCFGDNLNFQTDIKGMEEALLGKAIVEIPELTGLGKADSAKIKSFLSRTHDQSRLTYRKHNPPRPRRCIIAGTTNDLDCLPNDPSGNRRLVAINLERGNYEEIVKYMDENIEQMYAEGIATYRAGKEKSKVYLPVDLKEIQQKINAEHKRENTGVVDIVNCLQRNDIIGYSSTQIKNNASKDEDLEVHVKYIHVNQFAPALKARGYIQKHIDGQKRWFPKKDLEMEIHKWKQGKKVVDKIEKEKKKKNIVDINKYHDDIYSA